MTIAIPTFDDPVTVQPAPDHKTRVLLLARTPAFGARMAEMMDADPTVAGTLRMGVLADLVLQGGFDWSGVDFLVFQAQSGNQADLAALSLLAERTQGRVQSVAMFEESLSEVARQVWLDAGAVDALFVAPAAPPEPALPATGQVGQGQVSMVLRARGGAGASTVATNLAVALAASCKVVLVDFDLQNGTIAPLLDLPDSAEFSRLVQAQAVPDAGFLDRALVAHASGLHVLAAPDVFAPMTALSASVVEALLQQLCARFDHVIVDMPQTVVDWFEPVAARAARAFVVTDTAVPSIKRARRLIEVMTEDHMTLPMVVVVNGEARPLFGRATVTEAARVLDRPLSHWIPADAKAARTARDMGVPLMIGAKRSAAARAFRAMAAAMLKPVGPEKP